MASLSAAAAALSTAQYLQYLTDGKLALLLLWERQVLLHLVSVAATLPRLADVPGFGEIVADVVGAAFGDAQIRGDVA